MNFVSFLFKHKCCSKNAEFYNCESAFESDILNWNSFDWKGEKIAKTLCLYRKTAELGKFSCVFFYEKRVEKKDEKVAKFAETLYSRFFSFTFNF